MKLIVRFDAYEINVGAIKRPLYFSGGLEQMERKGFYTTTNKTEAEKCDKRTADLVANIHIMSYPSPTYWSISFEKVDW